LGAGGRTGGSARPPEVPAHAAVAHGGGAAGGGDRSERAGGRCRPDRSQRADQRAPERQRGSTATGNFTQSEASTIAFGSTIIASFNDSGSNAGGTNKFTGWSRSTDGGATWVDGGTLPTNAVGDAGDPVLARDELTAGSTS